MLILLTNDDGIHAPGLAAMERQLQRLGQVCVVAPATEQSGVGHSITYLTPLIVKEVYHGSTRWGWAVEGSPADCVKLAVNELCPQTPDLVVSGINGGLNAGINVLYSGTVAAAIEGAFFGITSVAVSLEFDEQAPFERAARLATDIIEQVLAQKGPDPRLFSLNIPIAALEKQSPEIHCVPMDTSRYGDEYEQRTDPWGRHYYWATGKPAARFADETDLSVLSAGHVALTPLGYNLTEQPVLRQMEQWRFDVESPGEIDKSTTTARPSLPVVRSMRKMQRVTVDPAEVEPEDDPETKTGT
ncbi:MAG: 5'/3'-nucleotidase SurE [Pirellulales bacterium]|nr:5'/3'-nucleotidase SurE [Pirellulales bacterium]